MKYFWIFFTFMVFLGAYISLAYFPISPFVLKKRIDKLEAMFNASQNQNLDKNEED